MDKLNIKEKAELIAKALKKRKELKAKAEKEALSFIVERNIAINKQMKRRTYR
jgi:hypothetical protein